MLFLLIHIIGLHAASINPNNNASSRRQETRHLEARANRAAQPTMPALDIHINRQYLRSTWSTSTDDIHTSHLTVDKQNWLSYTLVDTRRRTTVESAVARNGSWCMVDAGRSAV